MVNWNVTVVTDTGTELIGMTTYGYIEIVDGEGAVCAAMNDNDLGCVIYDFWDLGEYASADYHTFGDWLSVTYIGGNDETEFEDADHDFQPFMQGWLLVPEAQKLGLLEITEVDAANDLVITKGDAAGMAGTGGRYWIIPPAGVNSVTGAIETDPCKMGSLWLWAGYHYRAPIAGFHVDPEGEPALGIYGKQNGPNQAGTYECWNRVYEPQTGRWITPDPAMTPWTNLFDYVKANPTASSDPIGLFTIDVYEGFDPIEDWLKDADDEADALAEAADNIGGVGASTKNAKKDDLDFGLSVLGKGNVFIFIGHGSKKGIRGKANTKRNALIGFGLGAIPGGIVGKKIGGGWGIPVGGILGGAIGAGVGAAASDSEALEGDEFDAAAKSAEGVVILLSCNSWHLSGKFEKSQCFCGYEEVCSIDEKIKQDAANMAAVISSIPKGQCRSWSWIIGETNKKDPNRKPLAQDFVELQCTESCQKVQLCNK